MKKSAETWLRQLSDPNPEARQKAKLRLGGLTNQDTYLLDGLTHALGWAKDDTLFWAIIALGCLGRSAAPSIPVLQDLILHRTFGIRQAVINSLANIGACLEITIPLLIKRLREDRNVFVRADAARALGKLGKGDMRAVKALLGSLQDGTPSVRWAASIALKLTSPHPHSVRREVRKVMSHLKVDDPVLDQLEVAVR